ncbi:ABC transporter substrate-binding protein [uncultured Photobacterium sp.]|uniref:ABC transporter substrate-binding protein n=1 Tax=uncultured Photobacterium sp. TaxID=173973 RepID=UPI00261881F5|nr:ABC transporter substrate-binding protein [uncultured Photobacterium sp.]
MFIGYVFSVHASQDVHFLHWWTSQGEAKSADIVKEYLNKEGFNVVNVPIQGGGGKTAKSILQARAIAGNPPDMAQLEGPAIKSWAALGFLHHLNAAAQQQHWDDNLLPQVRGIHQFHGDYVAIPITIHRLNWMWVNQDILQKHQLKIPETWEQLIDVFSQLKQKGVAPLALGNEPWQVVQLFENIAFGLGGPNYYRKAFIELDPDTLASPITLEVLNKFRRISTIVLPDLTKQRWEEATNDLLVGKRVFQITGDWVAGELIAINGHFPSYISCNPTPSKQPGFIYNMDSFALFKNPLLSNERANQIAAVISEPAFLRGFNRLKGSMPAHRNISMHGFNTCSLRAKQDFNEADKSGTLMPSIIDSMAVSPVIEKAASSELFRFFNDPTMKPEDVIVHMQNMGSSNLNL